jgi:hypothetical protein
MKYIKYTLIIIISIFSLNISLAQSHHEILPDAKLIKTENGYLIYGITKTDIEVRFYNQDLKMISEVKQPFNKGSRRIFYVKKLSDGYSFEMNFCKLIVNKKGEKVDYKEWTRDDRKNDRLSNKTGTDMTHYVPVLSPLDAVTRKTNYISNKGDFIEFLSGENVSNPTNGVTIGGGSKNKGKPMVRGFSKNEDYTYKLKWKVALSHNSIIDYQWYDLGNGNIFLYVSSKEDYIYKINLKDGGIAYQYELKLDDNIVAFSNIAVDNEENLIVVANYMKKGKTKKSAQKGMDGWCVIKLDKNGKEIAKKSYEFEMHIPKDFKGRDFDEDDMSTRCISFRYLDMDKDGNVYLIGENIRLFSSSSTSTSYAGKSAMNPSGYKTTTSFGNLWQTYGLSYFKLDKNFKMITNNYSPQLIVSSKLKQGASYSLVSNVYGQDIYSLISEYKVAPLLNYTIKDFILDENNTPFILFSQIVDFTKLNYCILDISSDNEKKIVETYPIDKTVAMVYGEDSRFPKTLNFSSPSKVVIFDVSKKGYTFKIKEL